MRKSWEEATKQRIFRIDESGCLEKIDISTIENEDVIEWEYIRHNLDAVRMPLGFSMFKVFIILALHWRYTYLSYFFKF